MAARKTVDKAGLYAAGKLARAEQEQYPRGSPKWRMLQRRIDTVADKLQALLAKELREERNKYLVGLGFKPEPAPKKHR